MTEKGWDFRTCLSNYFAVFMVLWSSNTKCKRVQVIIIIGEIEVRNFNEEVVEYLTIQGKVK